MTSRGLYEWLLLAAANELKSASAKKAPTCTYVCEEIAMMVGEERVPTGDNSKVLYNIYLECGINTAEMAVFRSTKLC